MSECPCGSGRAYDVCCEPYVSGREAAPTAEALMRARYSSFVVDQLDYIVASHHPRSRDKVDMPAVVRWNESATWTGLEILDTQAGGPDDETGVVEFRAHYRLGEQEMALHERSRFKKKDGRWFYLDGQTDPGRTVRREAAKVGRNDPCPCGSGKKHKKCCGR